MKPNHHDIERGMWGYLLGVLLILAITGVVVDLYSAALALP